jgi:trehalose-phosphatase
MDDLRARVGIDSVIYGANHGLQIYGPGIDFVDSRALSVRQDLQDLLRRIDPRVPAFRGAWVEAKELTVSVHYRLCTKDDESKLREFLLEALRPFAGRLHLAEGKKVFEILPQTFWNKGAAAHWILMRPENYTALVFSFGDDRTDEDLFRTLPDAITVKIGDGASTAAKYRMDGPEQVREFLVWLGHNMPEYPVAA